uniref:TSPO associated protein 1 n=1 Tax=Salarias fasciatus TaxID=181472 RepID=A0A672G044_SALFA
MRQNSELLRALDILEKTCITLREENGLLRKSSAPETEEKVRRLRRKNTELAVLAKRLEDRARKLQEANLKVVRHANMKRQRYSHSTPCYTAACLCVLLFQESELSKKRKECENLEHEVKKRQKRCLDLVSRPLALVLPGCPPTRAENEELREDLSEVTAQHNSVLEENQRLRAKLENLEQVLKHMREVAERRQQLELEHEQALAILKFKQDEIKRLQRAQLFAKREHEGVVQMLEVSVFCSSSKVRELEEKCRSQSEQFGLLSQELEKFRLQASKVDLASSRWSAPPSPSTESCPPSASASQAPPPASRRPPTSPPSLTPTSVRTICPEAVSAPSPCCSQVDTASEVEELDIDVAPAPYTASRGAAKLQVFIARYSYNPYDGPNDNPEVELPLTAGEYIYVYGDMDDDGFYEGELMDGRRGLVPSNFVERVSDDDMMSAPHPETGDASHNSLLDSSLHSASHQHHLHLHTGVSASERTEASAASGPASAPSDPASALAVPAPLTNGLDLDLEEVGLDIVPYPRKLTLIKQLAKSIIIGWDPPLVPAGWGNVWSYNVYVDQELRLNVPFGSQTKAVLERLDINLKAYRVSVQSLTEKGLSDQLRCSMLVGRDVCVAPTQLRVERVTATSANLTWLPSNSNYVHIVSLNEEECELVKAGCYSLCLNNLLPSLQYTVKVEARPHRTPWELPVERREHRSTTISFSTLMAGPPDAPLDVQLEHGPSPGIALISWLPVTIDAAGTSNGVRVTGYTIYADKKKVLEVSSPTAGSALLGPSQMQVLGEAQELTVRTTSAHGESCNSLPVNVPSKLAEIMAGPATPVPVVPPLSCSPVCPSNSPQPASPPHRKPDEDVLERILKLPPQVYHNKQLFSIPEVTEEEDSNHEEPLSHRSKPRPRPNHLHPRDTERLHHAPQHHPHPHVAPHHHHYNRDVRSLTKEPLPRHGPIHGGHHQLPRGRHEFVRGSHQQAGHGPLSSPDDLQHTDSEVTRRSAGGDRRGVRYRRQRRARGVHPRGGGGGAGELRVVGGGGSSGAVQSSSPPRAKGRPTGKPPSESNVRIFVALFPYDPASMSPNPDAAEEELPFSEGQIIKVYGDKDADGFYRGESAGRLGYVPCNMVSEIQVEDEETRQQLLQQGFLSTVASMEKIGTRTHAQLPRRPVPPPKPRRSKKGSAAPAPPAGGAAAAPAAPPVGNSASGARRMVAIFDYDPRESSPNTDIEAELTFSAGDIIHVFGDMDEDGFFYGDLNGHKGLVPSNFLQALPEDAPVCAPPPPEPKKDSQVASLLSVFTKHSEAAPLTRRFIFFNH